MKKEIKTIYYFVDVGTISIVAIVGFGIKVSWWIGVLGVMVITLVSILGTVHSNNKIINN